MANDVIVAEEIVGEIRREHAAASTAARAALDHALECGRLLAEARRGIPHGAWEPFVRERCGIAPRTARLYVQLDANRERLANRQRVAGLTVREAALVIAERRKAPASVAAGNELRLVLPDWYSPGHSHAGAHPSGWCFQVWPHPHGDPWVHYFVMSAISGYPGDEGGALVGPKNGVRADFLVHAMEAQCANGMPRLTDQSWAIGSRAVDAATIAAEPFYNSWLFADDDDYRRRGLGIKPTRCRRAASST